VARWRSRQCEHGYLSYLHQQGRWLFPGLTSQSAF
jgi:hypothetical protein